MTPEDQKSVETALFAQAYYAKWQEGLRKHSLVALASKQAYAEAEITLEEFRFAAARRRNRKDSGEVIDQLVHSEQELKDRVEDYKTGRRYTLWRVLSVSDGHISLNDHTTKEGALTFMKEARDHEHKVTYRRVHVRKKGLPK